jgi:hypothetical protein
MSGWLPGDLIATDAHSTTASRGPCAICAAPMERLQYIARIADTGQLAHVPRLQLLPAPQPRQGAGKPSNARSHGVNA